MRSSFGADEDVCVWLDSWHVTNGAQYFGTILAIIAISATREWINVFRQIRRAKAHCCEPELQILSPGLSNVQSSSPSSAKPGDPASQSSLYSSLLSNDSLVSAPISSLASSAVGSLQTSAVHITVSVKGMTCQACVNTITKSFKTQAGVKAAVISLAHNTATLVYDPSITSAAALIESLEDVGYSGLSTVWFHLTIPTLPKSPEAVQQVIRSVPAVRDVQVGSDQTIRVLYDVLAGDKLPTDVLEALSKMGHPASLGVEGNVVTIETPAGQIDVLEQAVDATLYGFLLFLAYLLMLVIMTYNVGLCLAVFFAMALANGAFSYLYRIQILQYSVNIVSEICH